MALFKKSEPVREVPAVEEIIAAPEVKKPKVFQPSHKTIIGKGITFVGDFVSEDPIEVNGTIEGNVVSQNTLIVNDGGVFDGDAKVSNTEIYGYIKGNIVCDHLTHFSSTGNMDGNLKTKELKTDAGSSFTGNVILQPAKKAPVKVEPAPVKVEPAPVKVEPVPDLSEDGDIPVTEADLFN